MRVKRESMHDEPTFQISNKWSMLFERPDISTATKIRQKIELPLLRKYQTSREHFLKKTQL